MSEKDSGTSAKEKAEQDSRWISEFSDDLTVAIALRKWEEAVALVEEGDYPLVVQLRLSECFGRRDQTQYYARLGSETSPVEVVAHCGALAVVVSAIESEIHRGAAHNTAGSSERRRRCQKYFLGRSLGCYAQACSNDHI